jgi:hypothetical protein
VTNVQKDRLIESVVEGIVGMLVAQLPATLSAMQVAIGDGIVLDPPANVFDYKPALAEITAWPTICVLAGPSRTNADAGSWMDAQHDIAICAFVQDQATRDLSLKLLRYQRAIIEIVQANRSGILDRDSNQAWTGLNFQSTVPGNRFRHDSDPKAFVDYTTVMVRAMRQENF